MFPTVVGAVVSIVVEKNEAVAITATMVMLLKEDIELRVAAAAPTMHIPYVNSTRNLIMW